MDPVKTQRRAIRFFKSTPAFTGNVELEKDQSIVELAASFENISSILQLEYSTFTVPLLTKDRIYLRRDSVTDLDNLCWNLYLFSDLLIISHGSKHFFLSFQLSFSLLKVGEKGMLVNRKDLEHAFQFLFPDESQRDIWVAQALVWINTKKSTKKVNLRKKASFQQPSSSSPKPSPLLSSTDQDSSATVISPISSTPQQDNEEPRAQPKIMHKQVNKKASILSILSISSSNPSPDNWIPDSEAAMCMICQKSAFTFFNRKHHCRSCGRVICSLCSQFHEKESEKVRTCLDCFHEILAIEQEQESLLVDLDYDLYDGVVEEI